MSDFEIHHNDPDRFWSSRGPELADALVAKVREIRLLTGQVLDLVGELDRDEVHRLAGYGSLPQFLAALVRVSPRQARQLIGQAAQVCQTPTPTGHRTPPPLAATRAALLDGVIDGEHIDIIGKAMHEIPHWVDAPARAEFESALAESARAANPTELRARADRMLAVLDQDGPEPDDTVRPKPHNTLSWQRKRDGRVHGRFELGPGDGAAFDTLMHAMACPRPDDPRGQAERNGDALAEVCALALADPSLPTEAGDRVHLHLTADIETLRTGVGHATLDSGVALSAAEVRVLACDSAVIPYVLDGGSRPLDVGRLRYTIPTHLRRALILRDKGCAFPHCDRRPRSCHGHHVRHWANGGPTSLDNLVLVCARHHRLVHNSDWQVAIVGGLPEFTPPSYLDLRRRPWRNTLHTNTSRTRTA
ncbi:DUF222 domain-containing protein [Actinokineospora sp.]|uniref:DUF222 domain-containing protein n=1 Tax=Actinokineospora sp. TaxID=1872133 RepID=UPI004037BAB6